MSSRFDGYTILVNLHVHDITNQLTGVFADACQLLQFCHQLDVVGDVVQDDDDEAPFSSACPPSLSQEEQ